MARKSEGVQVFRRAGKPSFSARWTLDGVRVEVSTGERDRSQALKRAASLYADALAKKPIRRVATARAASTDASIKAAASEWIEGVRASFSPHTAESWEGYGRLWAYFWDDSLGAMLADGAGAAYARERLDQVLATTVRKEVSAMRGFFAWLHEQGRISHLPTVPPVQKRALGVRSGTQREKAVELSPDEVQAFLRALPIRSPRGFPVRAALEFMYETGLRPNTIAKLAVPRHWRPGQGTLTITKDIDKARFAREVPLTARALELLEAQAMTIETEAAKEGRAAYPRPVWGPFVARKHVARAGNAIGIPGIAEYDLRHARVTHNIEAGGDLLAVGYLVGHTQVTTTAKYAHGSLRAARRVVAFRGPISGTPFNPHERPMPNTEKLLG